MKKTGSFSLAALFLLCAQAFAANEPRVVDFLNRLNKYYYCLDCEGLRTFQCDVTATATGVLAPGPGNNQYRMTLSYLGKSLNPVLSSVGTPATEEQKETIDKLVLMGDKFIDLWALFYTKHLFRPGVDGLLYKVLQGPQPGFKVVGSGSGAVQTIDFDKQALAKSLMAQTPKGSVTIKLVFDPTPKGAVPKELVMDEVQGKKNLGITLLVEYQTIEGFQLPSSFTISSNYGGQAFNVTYLMGNYRIHGNSGSGEVASGETLQVVPSQSELPGAKHFFWRIRSSTATVYLMGSIHERPDIPLQVPEVVERNFEASNFVGFEIDLSQLDQIKRDMAVYLQGRYRKSDSVYPPNDNLLRHLTPAQWQAVRALVLQDGFSEKLAVRLKPNLLAKLLEDIALRKQGWDMEQGVDMIFLKQAKAAGKPTFGMEFWWDSLKPFEGLDEGDQVVNLLSTVKNVNNNLANINNLYRLWRTGDITGMEAFYDNPLSPEEKQFNDKVVKGRNEKWLPQFDRIFRTRGTYFIIVGAAHLVGPFGLPNWLKARGYEVEQL